MRRVLLSIKLSDGEMVGGAVVIINESTQHNHLDLAFVKKRSSDKDKGKEDMV